MQQARECDLDVETAAGADALAELAARSIRVPSVTGAERDAADWYLAWMRANGWDAELQLLHDSSFAADEELVVDRANVIAYPFGRPTARDRVIVINGHIDVVPADEIAAWRHHPFSGVRESGRVYGRGAVDTKGGIAAALHALESLRRAGVTPSLLPVVHLVIGEEITGVGTRLALAQCAPPAAAIVLEPTGGEVVTACSGLQFFEVEARGRPAHSSAPWQGVDALVRLLVLRDAMLETAAARSSAYQHPRFADVPTAIPFNVGTLEAGTYRAAVPGAAVMAGRIGLRPGEDPMAARAEFADALARAVRDDPHERELPHRLTWSGEAYPGWETDDDAPIVSSFLHALEATHGTATPRGFTAGNDAGQYAAMGAATVVFGPGEATLAHTSDESVAEDALARASCVLARVIESVS